MRVGFKNRARPPMLSIHLKSSRSSGKFEKTDNPKAITIPIAQNRIFYQPKCESSWRASVTIGGKQPFAADNNLFAQAITADIRTIG
jgi:hypothetical protein